MNIKYQSHVLLLSFIFFGWGCTNVVVDNGPLIVTATAIHGSSWGKYRYVVAGEKGSISMILYSNKKFNIGDTLTIDVLGTTTAEAEKK